MSEGENADESGTSKNNPTKHSLQSENTMASTEDEEVELEDIVWNLMGKTGLLTDLKTQVSKFVQDYVITNTPSNVVSDRVDSDILTLIYEYLHWAGLKHTCVMMLSESPMEFPKMSNSERRHLGEDYKPQLHVMVSKSKDKSDDKVFTKTPNGPAQIKLEDQISNNFKAKGDEINFSSARSLNETYDTSPLLGKDYLEAAATNTPSKDDVHDKTLLNGNTFENIKMEGEVPKETGDNLMSASAGDIVDTIENKEKQDFSGLGKSGKSYTDTFEEESLGELEDDLSFDKDKVPQSLTANSVNTNESSELVSDFDAKEAVLHSKEQNENHVGDVTKENEDKSNISVHVNNVKDLSTSVKSESNHFDEESISELLEDFSLDNTEDITVPSGTKDASGCDYVVKLS